MSALGWTQCSAASFRKIRSQSCLRGESTYTLPVTNDKPQPADLISYFKTVHPGFPLLDERLHTPSFVRARSAYLFTVILAVGATSIAILPHATNDQARRATNLRAHIDKLQLVLCATAAKSVEIIQAELVSRSYAHTMTPGVERELKISAATKSRSAQTPSGRRSALDSSRHVLPYGLPDRSFPPFDKQD